jgi:hypothetical protein
MLRRTRRSPGGDGQPDQAAASGYLVIADLLSIGLSGYQAIELSIERLAIG